MDKENKVDENLHEELNKETENIENDQKLEDDSENSEEQNKNDENARLKDSFARLQADFTNYKRRSEKERSDIYKYASEGVVTKLLPVLDNLERAFNEVEPEDKEDAFTKGVDLIKQDLEKILSQEGLEEIKSDGEEFDANLHHAVFMEENPDVKSGHIIETFQKGYKLNDKVIRPAMVKVSK